MKRNSLAGVLAAILVSGMQVSIADDTVKVGVLLPLAASFGAPTNQAIALAQSERPTSNITLVVEDSKCETSTAITAAKKLVTLDKVKLIIGDACWTDLIARITEPAKVVVLSPGSAQTSVRSAGDYVFRLKLDVSVDSRALARTLIERTQFRSAAVLNVQDRWGEGIASNFSDEFIKAGGKVVAREEYLQGSADFRSVLLRLKGKPIDVLVIGGYPADVGQIARQGRELGVKVQLAAYRGSLGEETLQLGGEATNGLLFMEEFDPDSPNDATKRFVSAFRHRYGVPPNLFAAMGYDAYNLFADAIGKCRSDTDCIRDFLYGVKDYPGASGVVSFDKNGDVEKKLTFKRIMNGRFVEVK